MNKNSKNAELLAIPEIKKALDAGHVVVVDMVTTSNPGYINVYMAQFAEGPGINSSSSVNKAQALLLKFDSKALIRGIQNADVEMANQLKIGDSLNTVFGADFALEIHDSFIANPDFDHSPRATKEGEVIVCAETGQEIFREVSLTTKDEVSHNTIKAVVKSKYKGEEEKAGVSKTKLEGAKS